MKFFLLIFSLAFILTLSTNAFAQQVNKRPDCSSQYHRQFDFWAGDWVVTDKHGNIMGYNKIDLILNQCALQENWQGATGSNGKSFNFYDRQSKQWHQTWIDNSGGILYLDGNLQGNAMIIQGTRLGQEGKQVLHRISYTPLSDGRVRQHWQASDDTGKTWNEVFLGFYEKRGTQTSMQAKQ